MMYWWFGIFRPHEWIWLDVSSLRIPLLVAIVFILPALLRGYVPKIGGALELLMVSYVALASLGTFLAGCAGFKITPLSFVVTLVVMVLVSERVLSSQGGRASERLIIGLVCTMSLSLLVHSANGGFSALLSGRSLYNANVGGGSFTGTNAIALGTAMAIFNMLFLARLFKSASFVAWLPQFAQRAVFRRAAYLLIWSIVLFSVFFVVATQSRGSALALGLGIVIWALMHPKTLRILLGAVFCATVILVFVPVSSEYKERIASAFVDESELDASAASRPHFWSVARLMARDYPLGVGVGCYPQYYNVYDASSGEYGRSRSVHSSHFAVLAETGWPGLMLWFAMFVVSFFKLFAGRARALKNIKGNPRAELYLFLTNALICSQIVFLAGGSFYEMPYNDLTWMTFGIVIAVSRLTRLDNLKRPTSDVTSATSFQIPPVSEGRNSRY